MLFAWSFLLYIWITYRYENFLMRILKNVFPLTSFCLQPSLFESQVPIRIANDTRQNNAFKIKISPSPCILETYSSASECAMVYLRHPFESVARTIKQKRLANRDKNPVAIFFCSLPRDRRAIGGWLNSVHASTDKRQTPLSSSFVCFKRHLFGGLDGLARGFSRFEGVKRSSKRIRGEGRARHGAA